MATAILHGNSVLAQPPAALAGLELALAGLELALARLRDERDERDDLDDDQHEIRGADLDAEETRLEVEIAATPTRTIGDTLLKLRVLARALRREDLDLAEKLVASLERDLEEDVARE